MKKAYVTPTVEKVEFRYDRVVVASGGGGTAPHTWYDSTNKVCAYAPGNTGTGLCGRD